MNHNILCVQSAFEVGSTLLTDEMKEGRRKALESQEQAGPCHGMQALIGWGKGVRVIMNLVAAVKILIRHLKSMKYSSLGKLSQSYSNRS